MSKLILDVSEKSESIQHWKFEQNVATSLLQTVFQNYLRIDIESPFNLGWSVIFTTKSGKLRFAFFPMRNYEIF